MTSEKYKNLILGKGAVIVEGKTHWKDFIQVYIQDPKEAFSLAMNILRQKEGQQFSEEEKHILCADRSNNYILEK